MESEKFDNSQENNISEKKQKTIKEKIREHRLLFIIVILLAVIILIRIFSFLSGLSDPAVKDEKPVRVSTQTVSSGDISATSPVSGRIAPVAEAAIVPLASGKVTQVNVKVGDYVTAGTVLFEIDKSQVAANYNQAKAAYNLASSTYRNMQILYSEGAVSKADFDSVEVNYISAQEAYNAAAEIYSYYSVTSPINGYVTSLTISVGNIAGQSMAASVADTSSLKISGAVSEYIAASIKIGDPVEVYVKSLGETPFKGTISELSPAPALGALTYPVTITLDNSSGRLMPGMFAEVKMTTEKASQTICIPSDAVITKGGRTVVVVLDDKNIPSYRNVTTGIDNGTTVQITDGLRKGEVIVVSGQNFVNEGKAVEVIDKDKKTDGKPENSKAKNKNGK